MTKFKSNGKVDFVQEKSDKIKVKCQSSSQIWGGYDEQDA